MSKLTTKLSIIFNYKGMYLGLNKGWKLKDYNLLHISNNKGRKKENYSKRETTTTNKITIENSATILYNINANKCCGQSGRAETHIRKPIQWDKVVWHFNNKVIFMNKIPAH